MYPAAIVPGFPTVPFGGETAGIGVEAGAGMVDATDKPAEPAPAPEAPDKAAAAAPGRGFSGLAQLGAVAIVAVAVLVAIYLLSGSGRPFQISLDKEGRFSVEAKPGDNFATILAAALKEDPQTVEALLAGNSFYKITSPQLVDAISRIDAKADATAEVTHGMRELLWNLAGPFQPPGTLDGADERLINALEDLDSTPGAEQSSRLLAGIWQRSLDRTGVFRPRSFNADVKLIFNTPPAPAGEVFIYACPGSGFVGKDTTVWTEGEHPGAVTGVIVEDLQRFDCDNADKTLEQLLAGQAARLALDGGTYRNLLGEPDTSVTLPPRIAAKFRVHPKDLTAAVTLPR